MNHYPEFDLTIHGTTYAEKKEYLRNLAQEWQRTEYDWSYEALSLLGNYFESNGKRYGLLEEFRENGII